MRESRSITAAGLRGMRITSGSVYKRDHMAGEVLSTVSFRDDGGVSGWFSSGGPRVRFLTRCDGEDSPCSPQLEKSPPTATMNHCSQK